MSRRRPAALLAGLIMAATPALAAGQAGAANPHGPLPEGLACADCHTTASWTELRAPILFQHDSTSFDLDGMHEDAPCASCHTGLRFDAPQVTVDDCAACHLDVHMGSIARPCASCHTTRSFAELATPEPHPADWPLEGAHLQVTCESCHTNDRGGAYAPLETSCFACHSADYTGAPILDHVALGFSTDCTECHSFFAWRDIRDFDHVLSSGGFPLVAVHSSIECTSCHAAPGGGVPFAPADEGDCIACHQADYQREHGNSGFPTDCTNCHTQTDWDNASFDHALVANFPLTGRHARADCSACHAPDGSTLFPAQSESDCVACHQSDFNREHDAGFPTDCVRCHTTSDWDADDLDHVQLSSGFALETPHATLPCLACHVASSVQPLFNPTGPDDCVACHRGDFEREHAGSAFPAECTVCHDPEAWAGAVVDHGLLSAGFPLPPDHADLLCTSCHVPDSPVSVFDPDSPEDCVGCHRSDYDASHGAGSSIPTDCVDCHATVTWGGAVADHALLSGGFALPDAHDGLDCGACHLSDSPVPIFDPTSPDDCVGCHQGDYVREHAGSGFPAECTVCHQPTTWTGATADHAAISGGFLLVGNHGDFGCTACHLEGSSATLFAPTAPEDCYACHTADYAAKHTGSGFPTDCTACHSPLTWAATLNHDASFFPIYSGEHGGEWSTCADCHISPSSFATFSCLNCHEHRQSRMDSEHDDEAGYVYASGACLNCHPTGKSG